MSLEELEQAATPRPWQAAPLTTAMVNALKYALARVPVPAPSSSIHDHATALAPLVIESGFLDRSAPSDGASQPTCATCGRPVHVVHATHGVIDHLATLDRDRVTPELLAVVAQLRDDHESLTSKHPRVSLGECVYKRCRLVAAFDAKDGAS